MKNYNKQLTVFVPENVRELNNYLSSYEGCHIYEFQKRVDPETFSPHIIYLIFTGVFIVPVAFVDVNINLLVDKDCSYELKEFSGDVPFSGRIITKKEEVKNVEIKPKKWYQFMSRAR